MKRSLLLLRLFLCGASWSDSGTATAAEQPTVVGITFGVLSQTTGHGDQPALAPGFGGSALGGLFFVDYRVNERVSIGALLLEDETGHVAMAQVTVD
jgi:hypothetical protein